MNVDPPPVPPSVPPPVPPLPVVPGHLSVECRLVVTAFCPRCERLHRHMITAADRPMLPGPWLWRETCDQRTEGTAAGGGAGADSYVISVSLSHLRQAHEQLTQIVTHFHLTDHWFE